jgi:hypothetical protein
VAQGGQFDDGAEQDGGQHQEAPGIDDARLGVAVPHCHSWSAHVAYAEAIVAIRSILGERPVAVDYGKFPWIVYTHLEVSWVGMTEAEARAGGHDLVVHRGHFAGNGRAMIVGSTDGIVKVIAPRDGPLLGVHLAGPWASELLAESYLAVNWQATPGDTRSARHPGRGRRVEQDDVPPEHAAAPHDPGLQVHRPGLGGHPHVRHAPHIPRHRPPRAKPPQRALVMAR